MWICILQLRYRYHFLLMLKCNPRRLITWNDKDDGLNKLLTPILQVSIRIVWDENLTTLVHQNTIRVRKRKLTTFTLNKMKIINTKHTNKKEENIKILRAKRKSNCNIANKSNHSSSWENPPPPIPTHESHMYPNVFDMNWNQIIYLICLLSRCVWIATLLDIYQQNFYLIEEHKFMQR